MNSKDLRQPVHPAVSAATIALLALTVIGTLLATGYLP